MSNCFINTSSDSDATTFLGSPFQYLTILSVKDLPDVQPEPPLEHLEAISSCPASGCLGEVTDAHLATASFPVVVNSGKISPELPFTQAKQPQLPQPLLIGQTL